MNFPLIMLILLIATGGIALLDRFALRRHRAPEAQGPWWVEYPKSFFPVILVVFCLRSFLVEPFKIPSGSMDFILVNKYTYGIRLPVINLKLLDVKEPQRGEVMVFRYPENPSMDYIKRIIGLPGDRIEYAKRRLIINEMPVPISLGERDSRYQYAVERVNETDVTIALMPERAASDFAGVVPRDQYFVLGDNRDNARDSRYIGYIPRDHLIGRVVKIIRPRKR